MYIYVVMVLFVTLMPFTFTIDSISNLFTGMSSANFTLFNDLSLNRSGAVRDIILNVVMMVPFGFLYPIIKLKGILKTVFMTFTFSLAIECSQLLSICYFGNRSFDITDLLTNTIGGLIGYLIFIILRPLVSKILNYNN